MDSGCLNEGEDLDHECDILRPLTPKEILWLMDELLSREVSVSYVTYALYSIITRLHGTWDIHSLRHCSRPSTSTACFGLIQCLCQMLLLEEVEQKAMTLTHYFIEFFGRIV